MHAKNKTIWWTNNTILVQVSSWSRKRLQLAKRRTLALMLVSYPKLSSWSLPTRETPRVRGGGRKSGTLSLSRIKILKSAIESVLHDAHKRHITVSTVCACAGSGGIPPPPVIIVHVCSTWWIFIGFLSSSWSSPVCNLLWWLYCIVFSWSSSTIAEVQFNNWVLLVAETSDIDRQ